MTKPDSYQIEKIRVRFDHHSGFHDIGFSLSGPGYQCFGTTYFAPDVFPRGCSNNVVLVYCALGVQPHVGKLDTWAALLEGTYADGSGDYCLAEIGNYTVAHRLHK